MILEQGLNFMIKFLTLCFLFLMASCQSRDPMKYAELITKDGQTIDTTLAITAAEHEKGLSGTQSADWDEDQGMLFYYLEDSELSFWMPDTYFDLDIFYLDKDLKVVDVVRKVPHFVGKTPYANIPRVRAVWARHVLEMKAGSKISDSIKVGDSLRWQSQLTLPQIESKIRQQQ